MNLDGVRDLWSEVESEKVAAWERTVNTGSRVLYSAFILVGFFLVVDLYTRPEPVLIKIFGVAAAILLVISSIFWAWATHHSAAGAQRAVAWAFWGVDIGIYAANLAAEYYYYMNVPMGDLIGRWYYNASMLTVVVSIVGWSLYSIFSPEQRRADAIARANERILRLFERGISNPSDEARETMNSRLGIAADALLTGLAEQTANIQFTHKENARPNGHVPS